MYVPESVPGVSMVDVRSVGEVVVGVIGVVVGTVVRGVVLRPERSLVREVTFGSLVVPGFERCVRSEYPVVGATSRMVVTGVPWMVESWPRVVARASTAGAAGLDTGVMVVGAVVCPVAEALRSVRSRVRVELSGSVVGVDVCLGSAGVAGGVVVRGVEGVGDMLL